MSTDVQKDILVGIIRIYHKTNIKQFPKASTGGLESLQREVGKLGSFVLALKVSRIKV